MLLLAGLVAAKVVKYSEKLNAVEHIVESCEKLSGKVYRNDQNI